MSAAGDTSGDVRLMMTSAVDREDVRFAAQPAVRGPTGRSRFHGLTPNDGRSRFHGLTATA